jgi:uncharacterized protein (DUF2147 family)
MKPLLFFILLIPILSQAQSSVLGKWKTIDDESGKERSIIELYEQKGLLFGKVIKTIPSPGEDPDPVCDKCAPDDPRFKKKVIGMEILKDMKKIGNEFSEGNILDPENGKVYRCKLWLEGANLMVRGYWGPFFRTQTWKKVH